MLELKIDELTEKLCPFWTRYSIWGKEGRHGGVENRDGWPSFVKSRQKDAETPYLNLSNLFCWQGFEYLLGK